MGAPSTGPLAIPPPAAFLLGETGARRADCFRQAFAVKRNLTGRAIKANFLRLCYLQAARMCYALRIDKGNSMARFRECPECGQDISDSYQGEDPDCGISGGWYCDACNAGYPDEDEPDYDE